MNTVLEDRFDRVQYLIKSLTIEQAPVSASRYSEKYGIPSRNKSVKHLFCTNHVLYSGWALQSVHVFLPVLKHALSVAKRLKKRHQTTTIQLNDLRNTHLSIFYAVESKRNEIIGDHKLRCLYPQPLHIYFLAAVILAICTQVRYLGRYCFVKTWKSEKLRIDISDGDFRAKYTPSFKHQTKRFFLQSPT